ncbi:Crp/Fnr family transcriptional regulator [Sphingobacterium kitahiroshimense]|uniref:Crp/Fnr family transcriptional regulator n=1 Tax=Sphingobacterium sp. B16(2022) TaxID=2914044 RepID=UPI00143C0434|nr:Crp/Fnr family transcriptional regulator [Sphingobacterium sp. B16(2022)]NJI73914.1 Crp/Fnr family transcriptional regulator [Sphingobacterium sp. B16(2022)]
MVTQLELLKHLEYLHQLNDEERFEMSKICKPLFLPKKTKLVESDDMFNYVFVLTTGLLRWYFYSEDGTENNVFFSSEADEASIIGIPEYYADKRETKYTIEAVTDTQILMFPKDKFEELAFQHKGIFQFYIKSLKTIINILRIRTEQFCSASPSTRYEDFLIARSYITKNTNRKYIANFLGITPNSLSRLSARIHKKRPPKK